MVPAAGDVEALLDEPDDGLAAVVGDLHAGLVAGEVGGLGLGGQREGFGVHAGVQLAHHLVGGLRVVQVGAAGGNRPGERLRTRVEIDLRRRRVHGKERTDNEQQRESRGGACGAA